MSGQDLHASGLETLVGPPDGARIFRETARTGFADCAPSGRVRLDAIARWLQDIAYADVADAGLASMAVWVVRKTRIRVQRFPQFGETLEMATFCSGLGRMWGERRTTIARAGDPGSDVEAVAIWVHLDPTSWRPIPFNDQEAELYGSAAAGRRVSARLHHPGPDFDGHRSGWSFRAVDVDIAGHVNNAAYWQPLEEELLSEADPERIDAEIEFRTPAQPGDKLLIRQGPRRWLLTEGEANASIFLLAESRERVVLG